MKKHRSAIQIRRARRRLIARAFPKLQLNLFLDNREAADKALAELEASLNDLNRELEDTTVER
jgi:hypothetical protein